MAALDFDPEKVAWARVGLDLANAVAELSKGTPTKVDDSISTMLVEYLRSKVPLMMASPNASQVGADNQPPAAIIEYLPLIIQLVDLLKSLRRR